MILFRINHTNSDGRVILGQVATVRMQYTLEPVVPFRLWIEHNTPARRAVSHLQKSILYVRTEHANLLHVVEA